MYRKELTGHCLTGELVSSSLCLEKELKVEAPVGLHWRFGFDQVLADVVVSWAAYVEMLVEYYIICRLLNCYFIEYYSRWRCCEAVLRCCVAVRCLNGSWPRVHSRYRYHMDNACAALMCFSPGSVHFSSTDEVDCGVEEKIRQKLNSTLQSE